MFMSVIEEFSGYYQAGSQEVHGWVARLQPQIATRAQKKGPLCGSQTQNKKNKSHKK